MIINVFLPGHRAPGIAFPGHEKLKKAEQSVALLPFYYAKTSRTRASYVDVWVTHYFFLFLTKCHKNDRKYKKHRQMVLSCGRGMYRPDGQINCIVSF